MRASPQHVHPWPHLHQFIFIFKKQYYIYMKTAQFLLGWSCTLCIQMLSSVPQDQAAVRTWALYWPMCYEECSPIISDWIIKGWSLWLSGRRQEGGTWDWVEGLRGRKKGTKEAKKKKITLRRHMEQSKQRKTQLTTNSALWLDIGENTNSVLWLA